VPVKLFNVFIMSAKARYTGVHVNWRFCIVATAAVCLEILSMTGAWRYGALQFENGRRRYTE
jgi:hypothetical protein